jgi:hypothetical protein
MPSAISHRPSTSTSTINCHLHQSTTNPSSLQIIHSPTITTMHSLLVRALLSVPKTPLPTNGCIVLHCLAITRRPGNNNSRSKFSSSKATYTKLSSTKTSTIPSSSNKQDVRVKISPIGSGITHVLLSRPSKLNSLDLPMFESIAEAASKLRTDPDCRVVILSGEGRAFCTGLDAKSVAFEGKALKRLLDRPSGYGGENGLGNLAQDVAYLWRYVNEFKVLCPVCLLTVFLFIQFSNMTFCY